MMYFSIRLKLYIEIAPCYMSSMRRSDDGIQNFSILLFATICSISTKVDLYVKQTYGGINLGGEADLHGKNPRDICSWSPAYINIFASMPRVREY